MNTVKINNLLLNKLFKKDAKSTNKSVKIKFEEALDFFAKRELLKKAGKENTNDYIKYLKSLQRNLIINKEYSLSQKDLKKVYNLKDNKIPKIAEEKNSLKPNERTFRALNKKINITALNIKNIYNINISNKLSEKNNNKSNSFVNKSIITISENTDKKLKKDFFKNSKTENNYLKQTNNQNKIENFLKSKKTINISNEKYLNSINNKFNDFISSKDKQIVKNTGKLKNTEDIKLNFSNKKNQDNKISFKVFDKKLSKNHIKTNNNQIEKKDSKQLEYENNNTSISLSIENNINKTSNKQKDLKIDKYLKSKHLEYNEEHEKISLNNFINNDTLNLKHNLTKVRIIHTKIKLENLKANNSVVNHNIEIKEQTDNSNFSFSNSIKKQSNTNFNFPNNTLFLNTLNINYKIKSTKKVEVNVSKTIKQLADIIKSKTIVIDKKYINTQQEKVYPTVNIYHLKTEHHNKNKNYFQFPKIEQKVVWKNDNQIAFVKENIDSSFNEINKNIPTNLIAQNIQKELKKTYKIENETTQSSISTNNDFSFDQGLDNNSEVQHINQAEKIEHIQSLKENINKLLSLKLNIENISIRASLVNKKLNIAIYTQTFGDIKTMKEEIKSIIQEYGFKEYKLEIKSKDEKISLNSKGKAREINVKV